MIHFLAYFCSAFFSFFLFLILLFGTVSLPIFIVAFMPEESSYIPGLFMESTPFLIVCGFIYWDRFRSGDYLRSDLGIISSPGIICGPGSFAGLCSLICRTHNPRMTSKCTTSARHSTTWLCSVTITQILANPPFLAWCRERVDLVELNDVK